jgi:hypothetical protein
MPENPEIERMLRQEAERLGAQAEDTEGANPIDVAETDAEASQTRVDVVAPSEVTAVDTPRLERHADDTETGLDVPEEKKPDTDNGSAKNVSQPAGRRKSGGNNATNALATAGTEQFDISGSKTLEHRIDAPKEKPVTKETSANRPPPSEATGAVRPAALEATGAVRSPAEAAAIVEAPSPLEANPFSAGEREKKLRQSIEDLPDLQFDIRKAKQELLGDPDGDVEDGIVYFEQNGNAEKANKLRDVAKQEQRLLDILDDATAPPESRKPWGTDQERLVRDLTDEFVTLPKDIRKLKTELFDNPDTDIDAAEAKLREAGELSDEQEDMLEDLRAKAEQLKDIPRLLTELRSNERKGAVGDIEGEEVPYDKEFDDLYDKFAGGKETGRRTEKFENLYELDEKDRERYEGRTVEIRTRKALPNPDRLFGLAEQDLRTKLLPSSELAIKKAELDALYDEGEAAASGKLDEVRERGRQRVDSLKRGLKNGQDIYENIRNLQSRLEQGATKENERDLRSAIENLRDAYGDFAERTEDDLTKKHNAELRDYAQEILTQIDGDKERGIPPDKQYLKDFLRYMQLRAQREERDDVG